MSNRLSAGPERSVFRIIGIIIAVASVIGIPLSAWYTYGRSIPLHIVLQADRYLAGPGEVIHIRAIKWPPSSDPEFRWSVTHGKLGGIGEEVMWEVPRKAGVYRISLRARRSATKVTQHLDIEVSTTDLEKLARFRPPPRIRAQQNLSLCPAGDHRAGYINIIGRPCVGTYIAASLRLRRPLGVHEEIVFSPEHDPKQVHIGPLAELRIPGFTHLPKQPPPSESLTVVAKIIDQQKKCVSHLRHPLQAIACNDSAGSQNSALFSWSVVGPLSIRLAARPPRLKPAQLSEGGLFYVWKFGDGSEKRMRDPIYVKTYRRAKHAYRVELRLEGIIPSREGVRVVRFR